MTIASPVRTRTRWWLLAMVVVLALTPGCHLFDLVRSRDKVEDKLDRPSPRTVKANLPAKYQFRVAPFVFISDWEIPKDQPLFKELADMRDQIQKELLLPDFDRAVIQVYLFEDKERYESYLKEKRPELPTRRAFFLAIPHTIGEGEDLHVYTYWSKRIRQDLRHELTHGLLHAVIKDVPQWLDEGLAEYFETPPEQNGINAAHARTLRKDLRNNTYKLGLARLEGLTKVEDMGAAEYREAWAWVHLMMRSRPEAKTVLLSYLHELRGKKPPGRLAPKLARVHDSLEEALVEHLVQIEKEAERTASASPPEPAIRR